MRTARTALRLIVAALFFCCAPIGANASCSGSGIAWSCTAGSTASQINSAISSATNEAVITLETGSYSFADVLLHTRNGVTIQCATVRGCTLSATRPFYYYSTPSDHKTNMIRVSGFVFSATGGPNIDIGHASGDAWIDKLRVDNNTFNSTTSVIAIGHTAATRPVWGVIDHNIFQGSTHTYPLNLLGGGDYDWNASYKLGGAENLFVEDNVFDYDAENLAASGMDLWHGGRMVVRYNTITNARVSVHGVCHDGPASLEVYNNSINNTSGDGGYRIVHHQGSGEFMAWGNTLSPGGATMALQHYRSSVSNPEGCGTCDGTQPEDGNRSPTTTYRGYPCYRQPGRNAAAELVPVYTWNNKFSGGTRADMNVEAAGDGTYLGNHIQNNRDIYQAASINQQTSPTSPFNGTSGVGFGTLANRPTTCTASAETGGGVGYFATDVGSQGTLYRCSAANTWTVGYTPYSYPHPLIAGGLLAPPTNLRWMRR